MDKERSRRRAEAHRIARMGRGGGQRGEQPARTAPTGLRVTIDQTASGPRTTSSGSSSESSESTHVNIVDMC